MDASSNVNNFNFMSIYKVHNLRENNRPGNWLEYWKKATKKKIAFCASKDCDSLKIATDGAHVQLDDSDDKSWYIVPLCHKCNCQFGKHFNVSGPLVSVVDSNKILK